MNDRLKHILSSRQFTLGFLINLYKDVILILELMKTWEGRELLTHALRGRRVGAFFWQESSRTLDASTGAAGALGAFVKIVQGSKVIKQKSGRKIVDWELAFSSAVKGAYLEDEFLNFAFCNDALILRTHRKDMPYRAVEVIEEYQDEFDRDVHVINAGNETDEHPIQTLKDVFTILNALGFSLEKDWSRLGGYSIAFINDLNARVVHSLALAAGKLFKMELKFISPPGLEMPRHFLDELESAGVKFGEHAELQHADFWYFTRLQEEYLKNPKKLSVYQNYYRGTKENVEKHDVKFVMHPFPRSKKYDELPRREKTDQSSWEISLDKTPRALYTKQMKYGLPVCAALLKYLLNPDLDLKKLKEEKLIRGIKNQCVMCNRIEYHELGWTELAPKDGYLQGLVHIVCPKCQPRRV